MSVAGRYTPVDLSRVSALTPGGVSGRVPPFSKETARFALELAATAYDFELDPWLDGGWLDVTIQVDDDLIGAGERRRSADWLEGKARKRANAGNAARQILGLLGKREDRLRSGKTVVMAKPLPDGRVLVTLAFAGTGKRLRDWLPNLAFEPEDGMHEGFLKLARQVLDHREDIQFPTLARAFSRDKLTLGDVFRETARESSRFLVFCAGHSQGAAVMQAMLYLLSREGADMRNFLGYGFASPMVVADRRLSAEAFPMYHIVNGDDLIPRVGARAHLGVCMVLRADPALRDACYQALWHDPDFRRMLAYCFSIRSTLDVLYTLLALVERVEALQGDEEQASGALKMLMGRAVPRRVLAIARAPLESGLQKLRERLRAGIERWERRAPSRERLDSIAARQSALFGGDAKKSLGVLMRAIQYPHSLTRSAARPCAPYEYIVNQAFSRLSPCVMSEGEAPVWESARRQAPARRALYDRRRGYSSLRRQGAQKQ